MKLTKTRTIWEALGKAGDKVTMTSPEVSAATGIPMRECSSLLSDLYDGGHVLRTKERTVKPNGNGGRWCWEYTPVGSGPLKRTEYSRKHYPDAAAPAFNAWLRT